MNQRTRANRIGLGLLVSGLAACGPADVDVAAYRHPAAGLYTPNSQIGASDPDDFPSPESYGNRCKPIALPDAGMPTEGALEVEYETQSLAGRYAPAHVTAVWIETAPEAGESTFVVALEYNAGLRFYALSEWEDRVCPTRVAADVVTRASVKTHRVHQLTWDGLDFEGQLAPDGRYRLVIEATETDEAEHYTEEFVFVKGPEPSGGDLPVAGDDTILRASASWVP